MRARSKAAFYVVSTFALRLIALAPIDETDTWSLNNTFSPALSGFLGLGGVVLDASVCCCGHGRSPRFVVDATPKSAFLQLTFSSKLQDVSLKSLITWITSSATPSSRSS